MTVEDIKKAIEGTDYEYYGIRSDKGIRYKTGETANASHQLFQDPQYLDDDMTELAYPYVEEGIYAGYYDAGEMDGTCAVGFNPDDDESIKRALEEIRSYPGNYIHVLGGNSAECGNDAGEVIIENAIVLVGTSN